MADLLSYHSQTILDSSLSFVAVGHGRGAWMAPEWEQTVLESDEWDTEPGHITVAYTNGFYTSSGWSVALIPKCR